MLLTRCLSAQEHRALNPPCFLAWGPRGLNLALGRSPL